MVDHVENDWKTPVSTKAGSRHARSKVSVTSLNIHNESQIIFFKMSIISGLDMFFFALFIFFLFWKILRKEQKFANLNQLPGPKAYPLVGNISIMLEPREETLNNIKKRHAQYGTLFRLWLGTIPNAVFSDPKDVEILLKSMKHSEKTSGYRFLHPWLGTGLLTSHGVKWALHRKLITPAFHFKILQSFLDVFVENTRVFVDVLKQKADTGEEFNIYPFVTKCTLDIICETAMGTKIYAQSEDQSEYVKSVYSLSKIIALRFRKVWLHPNFIFNLTSIGREHKKHLKTVQGFTESVIQKRKAALMERKKSKGTGDDNNEKLAFLDLLLEASMENGNIQLTDTELREEVDTFMFEGHDTTAASLAWTLFLLGNHPKIQEEVYQEVKAILENKQCPEMTDFSEMKLLERVIKESLRIYPSVTSIGRIIEEDVQFGKYTVPKGTNAFINIYSLHRNPSIYPNPEDFDPDRFLPEKVAARHPFAYLPFSAGPRNCIGQKFALLEEKVVLSSLILNYRFVSMKKPNELTIVPELILKPLDGITMKIFKR